MNKSTVCRALTLGLALWCGASVLMGEIARAADGEVSRNELSVDGIAIDDSVATLTKALGEPLRKVETGEGLEYHYAHVRASVGEGAVFGLFSDDPQGCTPRHLCPGDRLDSMRALYGVPLVSNRETGSFYEYYATGVTCWLQIAAKDDLVTSIAVACQP